LKSIEFLEFDGTSREEWMKKVEADLKGKSPGELDRSFQDLSYGAFYHPDDGKQSTGVQVADNDWLIRKSIEIHPAASFNKILMNMLQDGLQNPVIRGEFKSKEHLGECLEGLVPDYVRLDFELLGNPEQYSWVQDWLREHAQDYDSLKGGFNLHPDTGSELANSIGAMVCPFSAYTLYGSDAQSRGAFATTELAILLHEVSGLVPEVGDNVRKNVQFVLGLGVDYFGEMAKLRAARNLFEFLLNQYGIESQEELFIAAQTTAWSFTAYDRYNNLLRNSSAGLAAVIGGANALELLPHDLLVKRPNHFSGHLSITTQHMMKEESYLNRVVDPAQGSYFVEELTAKIEAEAWSKFQKLESGASAAEMIQQDKDAQLAGFESGSQKVLGVNLFPHEEERLSGEMEIQLNGLDRLTQEAEKNRLEDE
jgi:methylmalonyl-CoA mutase